MSKPLIDIGDGQFVEPDEVRGIAFDQGKIRGIDGKSWSVLLMGDEATPQMVSDRTPTDLAATINSYRSRE
jgi:hypothetical protein